MLCLAMSMMLTGQSLSGESDTQGALEWKLLSNDEYRIDYPSTWEVNESGQMGTSFILFSPVSSQVDDFRENINLLIQDLTGYGIDLDKYVEISEGQIKSLVAEGKIVLNERKIDEEKEYHRVIYTGKQGVFKLMFEQYYWIVNDKAYILSLTCKESEFDAYKKVGEKILNSFVIK